MQHILFVFFLLLTSLLFALIEIQIEGPHGWATGLPTWRFESRLSRALLGNRSITGYHVYTHLFILCMLHLPYALGVVRFSLALECRIFAFAFLFWVAEDFLWFLFNPAYGARGFSPERAWWHAPNWWWFMPRDYWLFLPIGTFLYVLSFLL